ncbi:MAG: TolC family protein [Treponema sp.]|jgi:outer membrane protein TolC|nr:TolC family protein [Treponema sp.]
MIQSLYGRDVFSDTNRSSGAGLRNQGPPIPAVILAVCFLWSVPLFSQEVRTISPKEAVDLAIQSNLGLESSRVSTTTKKRKVDTAWNVFIPTVEIGGSLMRSNVASTVSPLSPVPIPQWHVAGSLQIALNLNFALFEGMRNLQLEYESGLISYEKAKAQLERDVRKSYYQMLLVQENITLLKENFAAAERRVEMARANYRAGLAPELTLLQAQVTMENMKPTIDQAENGLKVSMAQFAMTLGLPYNTQFALIPLVDDTAFIPLDVADLISRAASGKPEIQELRQSILSLESARKRTFYQIYTPTLSLSWNADPTFQGDPWKDSWFMEDGWKQQSGMFRLTLGFRLNGLLPFSTEAQGLKDIDDTLSDLNIKLAQAIRGTEVEIYNTILSLEQTRVTVEAQRLTVDMAERSYRLTEQAYRAGLNDLLEVQNAELELRKARLGVLEQQFNYLKSLIDLEYAIGAPFGTMSNTRGNSSSGNTMENTK